MTRRSWDCPCGYTMSMQRSFCLKCGRYRDVVLGIAGSHRFRDALHGEPPTPTPRPLLRTCNLCNGMPSGDCVHCERLALREELDAIKARIAAERKKASLSDSDVSKYTRLVLDRIEGKR